MAARTHSADPRAERVRTLLREAAFELAHERPVDQLTVADIVGRAGVSRQVFYQHFADRDDAVGTAFTVAFAAATKGVDLHGDPRARIITLFDLAADHRAMYRNVVPSAVSRQVVAALRAELSPACQQLALDAMPVLGAISGLEPDAVSQFLVGGLQEVLRSWMEDPAPTDLHGRVASALDTIDALLGLHSPTPTQPTSTQPTN